MISYTTKATRKNSELRYERKFAIDGASRQDVEYLVKMHPALFSEEYNQRFINNIYLDSLDKTGYIDTINGVNERFKLRIRWYGDLYGYVKEPYLEIKKKTNYLYKKDRYLLSPFRLKNHFTINDILNELNLSKLPLFTKERLNHCRLSLLNRYKRKYFLSANRKFRVTIDSDLNYYALSNFNNLLQASVINLNTTILEIKYINENAESVRNILNYFPFRVTKSSKYVSGVNLLNFNADA